MRRILILEDDKVMRMHLCKIINDLDKDVEVYISENVKDAYSLALEYQIHLFLVDIILNPSNPGDVTGLDFIQEIRGIKRYEFIPIIIITTLQDPKFISYSQLKCYGFIEKPFDEDDVKSNISKALNAPVSFDQERYVFFRKDGITYSMKPDEIYYIDIRRRNLTVYSKNGEIEIPYKTAKEILIELGSPEFVQCSRYHIINRNYIEYIDYTRRFIKLRNVKESIEIGAVMKDKFKDEINGLYTC